MSGHTPRPRRAGVPLLGRAALWLYPPAWRVRYRDEVLALLEESGASLASIVSLAWRAVPAWICPPVQRHDRAARMRASVATILVAWAVLAGLGLVFDQLTQQQDLRPPAHPLVGWSYAIFDTALVISALTAAIGCLPLWLLMARRACREHSPRDMACLLLPVTAPAVFLITLRAVLTLTRHPDGVSPWGFLAITVLGLATAGIAAAGPGIVLRRQRPRGPALRLAASAAALAVATMLLASAASAIAATGLCQWAPGFAGYHDGLLLGTYLALLTAAGATATVSAARGRRAATAR